MGDASTPACLYDTKRRGKFPARCEAWFQKSIPWNLNQGIPWKASQLWFHGAAREQEQSLWQDKGSGLIPSPAPFGRRMGTGWGRRPRNGGWEADGNFGNLVLGFPHHSLAYQIGPEDQRGRKGSMLGRQGSERSMTSSEILPTPPHKTQRLGWTQRQHRSCWAYTYYATGLTPRLIQMTSKSEPARLGSVSESHVLNLNPNSFTYKLWPGQST